MPTPTDPTPTTTPTPSRSLTPTITQTFTRTPIAISGAVHIFVQSAPFSFVNVGSYAAGRGPSAVAVSDFNGDRNADFVVSSVSDDRVMFFYGNGTGQFSLGDPCPEDACIKKDSQVAGCCVGAGPRSILVTMIDDLSQGARPDLLVANTDGQSISVLLSSNPATPTGTVTPTVTNSPRDTNSPTMTGTITRTPRNTERPTATCPPSGICVQGEGCAQTSTPQWSWMMLWPWIGVVALVLLRRQRR